MLDLLNSVKSIDSIENKLQSILRFIRLIFLHMILKCEAHKMLASKSSVVLIFPFRHLGLTENALFSCSQSERRIQSFQNAIQRLSQSGFRDTAVTVASVDFLSSQLLMAASNNRCTIPSRSNQYKMVSAYRQFLKSYTAAFTKK